MGQLSKESFIQHVNANLSATEQVRVKAVDDFVEAIYQAQSIESGKNILNFSRLVAVTLITINTDVDTIIAGLLFEVPRLAPHLTESLEVKFGKEIMGLVGGVRQLIKLRESTVIKQNAISHKNISEQASEQIEVLRKMLLSMASDIRVVLIALSSLLITLRHFAENKIENEVTKSYAHETLNLYAPLANRLGIWQLKWELEDLAFRFLEPENYRRIAKMLEEKRLERESFVEDAIQRLKDELSKAHIKAEVSGRPKHIYSIWNKMKGKSLDFSELYDVRAFRVTVEDIKTCYAVLGLVHHIWQPIPKEFDDYISRPKPNGYRSLHTVVLTEDQRAIEIQIRTEEMHHFAEYGVAAHWRYKESGGSNFSGQQYDEKIAWLRQLLAWKNEVTDAVIEEDQLRQEWLEKIKKASLDDRIYVLTPHARIIELLSGATPVDFAYHLHTDVGHRCRGAKVNGVMVPLNTVLKNGQTVEIITAKGNSGNLGPSRDWLNEGYLVSPRARTKVRAWFNAIDHAETLANGRVLIEKTLQREGKTAVNLEELARKLGFVKVEELFLSVGKEEFSLRNIENILRSDEPSKVEELPVANKSRASSIIQGAKSGVLVVGTEGLLTQLAKCCRPAPPDDIVGFVTRGKGVSIHRISCKNFTEMRQRAPERVIQSTWGKALADTVYPVNIFVLATDRQALLRDISEILSREKINVIGVKTQSLKGQAKMEFTAEINSTSQLNKALNVILEIPGVLIAQRI
jgi:GTP pyrophosphokinase